jgi:hypothetical protein
VVSFLEGALATLANKVVSRHLYNVTLQKVTATSDGSGGFVETTADHTARGFVDEKAELWRIQGRISTGEVKIDILQKSTTQTPTNGDRIIARAETYQVLEIEQDPGQVLWECKARPWRQG